MTTTFRKSLYSLLLLPYHLIVSPFRFLYNAIIAPTSPTKATREEILQLETLLRSQLSHICKFDLSTTSSAKIILPDKRELGYAQYGDPLGKPLIKLHGLPGSRLEETWHDSLARKLGIRIIGVDRPGVGWSSPDENLSPRSFAGDIEFLAEELQLGEFSVLGTSGGGPYVMACARYLPQGKLKAAGNVCGMGDIQRFSSRGMGWRNWLGYRYAIHIFPRVFLWAAEKWVVNRKELLSEEERVEELIREIGQSKDLSRKDLEGWKVGGVDFLRLSLRAGREYFVNGYSFLLQDARILGSKWEFDVEDLRPDLSLHLWFGKEDENVSGEHGVEIARRFRGKAKLHFLEETHLSLQVKYQERILEEILEDM